LTPDRRTEAREAQNSTEDLHESRASSVHGAHGKTIESHAGCGREGDRRSLPFEDLFADQHERLYRALYLIVGNSHEAEELMQEAFLLVLERWDRIDNPAGYLYRSALNSTRSRFRRLTLAANVTSNMGPTGEAPASKRKYVFRSFVTPRYPRPHADGSSRNDGRCTRHGRSPRPSLAFAGG
jgi:hypothetical protein